jgi:hypothetical protein
MLIGFALEIKIPFFLQNACSGRRRNRIGKLLKENGEWVVEEDKRVFITDYFFAAFLYKCGTGWGAFAAAPERGAAHCFSGNEHCSHQRVHI